MLYAVYYRPDKHKWEMSEVVYYELNSAPGEDYFETVGWKDGFVRFTPVDPVRLTSSWSEAYGYYSIRAGGGPHYELPEYKLRKEREWEAFVKKQGEQ